MVNRCRCFHLCHYTWAQTLGIRWTAEHASIVMNSVWALLQKPMWYGWNSCKLSICWNHSKLFWADCKNPCAFWYFYVGVQVSWVTSLDTPFRKDQVWYTISAAYHNGAKLCNILSMLKRKIGSGGGNRALLRYEFNWFLLYFSYRRDILNLINRLLAGTIVIVCGSLSNYI